MAAIAVDGRPFTPLPVFPVTGTSLAQLLTCALVDFEGVERVSYGVLGGPVAEATPTLSASEGFILTTKLFGRTVAAEPPAELTAKVARHYSSGGQRQARIGFRRGLSPYYRVMAAIPPLPAVEGSPLRVAQVEHRVHLPDRAIPYDALVSTLPLPHFLQLLDCDDTLAFRSSGATFFVFSSAEAFTENHVIYDVDERSPVYRYFTPLPGILVVQASASAGAPSPDRIASYLRDVLGWAEHPTFHREIALSSCYPLDVSPRDVKEFVRAQLLASGIFLFGRAGAWEYRDLHELSWGVVSEISEYLQRDRIP